VSLRFSLQGLLWLVSLAALACAALVHPGPGWLSVCVSLLVVAVIVQTLRAVLTADHRRAEAVGWLLLVVAYLALTLGPGLRDSVGPQLASSKALAQAQARWRKEDLTATIDLSQADFSYSFVDVAGTVSMNNAGGPYTVLVNTGQTPVNCFLLAGHWLLAWIAGWLGAALAGHFYRQSKSLVEAR